MCLLHFHDSAPQVAWFTLHPGAETIQAYCVPYGLKKSQLKIPDDESSGVPQGGTTGELGWDSKEV